MIIVCIELPSQLADGGGPAQTGAARLFPAVLAEVNRRPPLRCRFQHNFGMAGSHAQQHSRGPARRARALLPMVKRADTDSEQPGELRLRETELLASGGDACLRSQFLSAAECFGVYRTSDEAALPIRFQFPHAGRSGLPTLDGVDLTVNPLNQSLSHSPISRMTVFISSALRYSRSFFA